MENKLIDKKENFVLCGDKKKHLEIPEGYILVTPEERQDVFVTKENIKNFKVANIRKYFWENLDIDEDIDMPLVYVGDHLIKKIDT